MVFVSYFDRNLSVANTDLRNMRHDSAQQLGSLNNYLFLAKDYSCSSPLHCTNTKLHED